MKNCNMHCEKTSLINELAQGRELARQLQIHLNVPSSSHGTRESLVQKIIVSYEKALSMLNSSTSVSAGEQQQPTRVAVRMVESPPPSLNGSPRSEDSDREFKDQDPKDPSRKRKTLPQQIRATSGMGLEGHFDDGFSWRKYGQKDILGAKYPRGYYRCTHRNVQGCLATKQVQRSDEDPTIFEITYRGRHTCTQVSGTSTPPSSSSLPDQGPEPQNGIGMVDSQQNQQQSQHMLLNIPQSLRVITEGLDTLDPELFPSFNNPLTLNVKAEDHHVSLPNSTINNSYVGSYSPSFISPSTSGTNYFSVSQQGFGGNQNFHSAESEIGGLISAATSATSSPTVGLGFPFGQGDQLYPPDFSFDGPGFFS